jgi:glycopeptide antibiotics resistance protein
MKKSIQHKNGFPSTFCFIIYIIVIIAVCFLTRLFSGAKHEPASMEKSTNWEISNY